MQRFVTCYDKKYFKNALMCILAMALVMKVTNAAAALAFPVCALSMMARKQSVNLLFVILLMIAHQVGNAFFFPNSAISVLSIRGTLLILSFLMATQLFGRRMSPIVSPFKGLFLYLIWEVFSSFQGFAPLVSLLKLLLFSLIYLAFIEVANDVILNVRADSRKVRSVILAIAAFFLIGSLFTIPFPAISVMTWGDVQNTIHIESLFKGLSSHSQCLGPMVALFNVVVLADMVFSVKRFDKLYLAILLAAPLLVFKSGSRTALGVYLVSNLVVGVLALQSRGLGRVWKSKITSCFIMVSLAGLVVIAAVPRFREGFLRFVLKKAETSERVTGADVTFTNVAASRLGATDLALFNFRKKPLIGNGFQVAEGMDKERRGGGLLAYLSAPIEKGVWVTAVLEEGGVVGFLFFAGFLFFTFLTMVRRKAYITAATLFSATMSNLGEFTFFSMTYTGGLVWIMVFSAVIMDAQRLREQHLFTDWLNGMEARRRNPIRQMEMM